MNDSKLQIVINAKDNASKAFNSLEKSSKKTIKALGALGIAAGASAVAVGAVSVKMAADFEKSMTNISTLIDTSTESMEEMERAVLDISKRTPVAIADLTSALYDVRSAGISAEGAMSVLENSAKLATTGLGTTKEATNILTSAINAFGLDAQKSDKWADVFFKTVKSGKTTVAELAQGFGQVAPLANALGVEFEELMAITAATTVSGMQASVAYTSQKAIMSNLLKPTKEMKEAMDKLGMSNVKTAIETKGFGNVIRELTDAADGNDEMIAKMFGSVEGLNEVLMITGQTGENATAIFDDMKNGSNAMNEAMKKQKATLSAYIQILKNKFGAVMIEVGTAILPKVIEALKFFEEIIGGIQSYLGTIDWGKYFNILKEIWGDIQKEAEPFVIMFEMWFEALKEALAPLMPELKKLWDQISELKPEFEKLAIILGGVVLTAILGTIAIIAGLVSAMVGASEGIIKMIDGLLNIFNNFIEFFVNVFTGNWAGAWENVKGIAQGAWNFLVGMFEAILGAIKGFGEGIARFFLSLYDQLVGHSIIPDMINAIINWFTVKLPEKVLAGIGIFKDSLVAIFTEVKDNVVEVMESMVSAVMDAVRRAAQALANAPGGVGAAIGGIIQDGMGAVGLPTMNDFISRPGSAPVSFSPQDTIIGVKNTDKIGGGGSVINITINGDVSGEELIEKVKDSLWTELKMNGQVAS